MQTIKKSTNLPIVVGFGVTTPEAAFEIASVADGVVVGSAIVDMVGKQKSVKEILEFVKSLTDGAHKA